MESVFSLTPTTPLMQQYFVFKKQYPKAFVFFQVGDFYELFFDDAVKASKLLSITLTTRGKHMEESIPLCGIPVSTIEQYSIRLAQMGHMVVLCKQNEKAVPGKIVSRVVDQIITPSSIIFDKGLQEDKVSYLGFLRIQENIELIFFEFLTLKLYMYEFQKDKISSIYALLDQYSIREIVYIGKIEDHIIENISKRSIYLHQYSFFLKENSILDIFKNYIKDIYPYVDLTQINIYDGHKKEVMIIDYKTQHHLDLLENSFTKEKSGSLYSVLDQTETSFGKRLLKEWIMYPLISKEKIEQRQAIIEYFLTYFHHADLLKSYLKKLFDLERIAGRIQLKKASYSDYQKLFYSLEVFLEMISYTSYFLNSPVEKYFMNAISLDDLYGYLHKHLFLDERKDDCFIKSTADEELQNLEQYVFNAHATILNFEKQKQQELGIEDLKIKEVPVHGYIIEISKSHNMPVGYIRVQTLANRERFVCEELKILEQKINSAQELYQERDKKLYKDLCDYVLSLVDGIKHNTGLFAELDVLISLAFVARQYNYKKPEILDQGYSIHIEDGVHPVLLELNSNLVSNSLDFFDAKKTLIITGPNMGGKSTFMRQNALIVLMAQMGSFVPAKKAQISLIDGIYTRLSSFDNILHGKSTFFIEMEDVKDILEKATKNSLVLLDEIGRGTSTYDGMRLAYAIIWYLNQHIQPYTLCATHYHELYKLLNFNKSIGWIKSSIIKKDDEIIFLFKMIEGNSEDSLGIEIAREAGILKDILKIANSVDLRGII